MLIAWFDSSAPEYNYVDIVMGLETLMTIFTSIFSAPTVAFKYVRVVRLSSAVQLGKLRGWIVNLFRALFTLTNFYLFMPSWYTLQTATWRKKKTHSNNRLYSHIYYLCHVASFNQWQCGSLPTKQKHSATPFVDSADKLVASRHQFVRWEKYVENTDRKKYVSVYLKRTWIASVK